ncbi:serine protease 7 isoform X2 [Aedes albopictus]|uniref:CLIP domain-containing serine protease n=1 Tax=Aedes albopictus TaxID=7160 RepID=A0ABM2A6M9_AEDAL|nr:serine protease 7-like isoform X2 [Aedes albopictus]
MMRQLSVLLFFVVLLWAIESHAVKSCRIRSDPSIRGRCVPVEQCRQMFSNLVSLQFQPNFSYKDYLDERICDYGANGSIHICCADESSRNYYNHRKQQARRSCLSFRNVQGTCTQLESCPSIYNCSMELQRNYNPTLHLHLTQSFCYQDNGKVYVCCDDHVTTPMKLAKKQGWRKCETPFLDAGKCVPASRCGLIGDKEQVPEEFQAFMVGCEQLKNVDHMCCPTLEVQYDTQLGKQCDTDDGKTGLCVELDRCEDALNAGDIYVEKNWCYTNLDQVEYVCCPKRKVLKVPEKTFKVVSRLGEDAPVCTTPNSTVGRCVALADCAPIVTLLRDAAAAKRAVTPAQANFLRSSVCSPGTTTTSTYYVCCDETDLQLQTPTTSTAPTTVTATNVATDIANHPNARLLNPTNCGRTNLDDKIAFGERAPMYQYPWMAMLIYRSATGREGPECGGTVINNRYILTAAHCIDGQVERLLYIRLGEYDTRTDPDCDEYQDCAPPYQQYMVEESLFHPNFTRVVRSGNDIGLLRVNRVIEFNTNDIMPICLPISNSLIGFDPALFWITGWGLTERLENSPILLQTRIPSIQCSLSSRSICAGFGNGTLHCRGDSGGPMKVQVPEFNFRYVQYGIISAGPGCGVPGTPGVSTRVSFFVQWILDSIRE